MAADDRDTGKRRPRKPSPPADVFVGLQFTAVAATIIAITLLALALGNYGWQIKP
jgi:hypothetical protein